MRDNFITIVKSDGSTEEMEVVAIFKLEDTNKNCIIYKSLTDNRFFAASYENSTDYSRLSTDFTEKEKEQLNKVFNELISRGENNVRI